jgi:antibiotic biosynthesis monooxygenase (ABM) superfamily enzyme
METRNPSAAATPGQVTRIARRRAQPGKEAQYEALIREMFERMRRSPGFLGAEMVPPEQAGGFYQIIINFRSEADLAIWDASPARADIHRQAREVAEAEPEYRSLSGLEAWFAPAVVPATMHPPRVRMAVVTWLGIFPTVSFFLWFVLPFLQGLPFLLRTAVFTALIVVTMTWVVMPRLTRLMRGFLNPHAAK